MDPAGIIHVNLETNLPWDGEEEVKRNEEWERIRNAIEDALLRAVPNDWNWRITEE